MAIERMRSLLLAGAVALALGGCASTPPEQDPVAIKLNDLDRRLERVERIVNNQSDLARQVQALQNELRSLRGEIEVLQHSLATATDRQNSVVSDFDRRLQTLEKGPQSNAAFVMQPGGALPVPGGSDRANYEAAYELMKSGAYDRAVQAFQQFIGTFPDSALADNAQYWLGECYYAAGNYNDALQAFRRVLEQYPKSRKLADSWLKIGLSQYSLGDYPAARETLTRVTQEFDGSASATAAQKFLERMTAEGR